MREPSWLRNWVDYKKKEKKALKFYIVREIIQIQSVKADLLEKNIGYLRLTSFNENSGKQIEKEIKKLEKNKNVRSYILDLRNNQRSSFSSNKDFWLIFK